MIYIYITTMTLNYGNYGIFLLMGNARFISSNVWWGGATRFQVGPVSSGGLGSLITSNPKRASFSFLGYS